MRFVTVREFRGKSAKIWSELAREQEMVITSRGKPIAILSAVSGENLESSLAAIRTAQAMAAVEAMQRQSMKVGKHRMTLEEISAEIRAARKERRK